MSKEIILLTVYEKTEMIDKINEFLKRADFMERGFLTSILARIQKNSFMTESDRILINDIEKDILERECCVNG